MHTEPHHCGGTVGGRAGKGGRISKVSEFRVSRDKTTKAQLLSLSIPGRQRVMTLFLKLRTSSFVFTCVL